MCQFLTDKKTLTIIGRVEEPFKSLPRLPQGIVDFLVKIAPWGVAIGGFFSAVGAISSLRFATGMNAMQKLMREYAGFGSGYFYAIAVTQLAMAWLAFKAFQPLKERRLEGWIYLFWMNIVALTASLIAIILGGDSMLEAILSLAIGLYFLFELKAAYMTQAAKAKKSASKNKSKPKKSSKKV